MKTVIADLKIELKDLAKTVRESRARFRKAQSIISKGTDVAWNGPEWKEKTSTEDTLNTSRYEFRHKHIVYCLLRGRTRDQIEKPSKKCEKACYCCNKPSESYLEKLLTHYTSLGAADETFHNCT